MIFVSFANSAPELFVSLQAVLNGSNDIALGNVIGSNIVNITLVLGLTALIFRLKIFEKTVILNYPFLLFSCLLSYFLVFNILLINLIFNLVLNFFSLIFKLYLQHQ